MAFVNKINEILPNENYIKIFDYTMIHDEKNALTYLD